MKRAFFFILLSITTSFSENNVYSPESTPTHETYDPYEDTDYLISEFIETARIRHQMEATFDTIIARFGGNIKEVRADMAEEMGRLGMSQEEVGARLRLMEAFSKKLHAAKAPLLSKMLEELVDFYKSHFTPQEIIRLIHIFKDPTMLKFQQESLHIMPEIMQAIHDQTMDLVKPYVQDMQAEMLKLDGIYGSQKKRNLPQGKED